MSRFSLGVAAAVAVLALSGCGRDAAAGGAAAGPRGGRPPVAVEVAAVEQRDLVETVTLVGSLAPNESTDVRPEIPGKVKAIRFEEGQVVRKGDVLVELDDDEVRAQLAQAQASFALAETNLRRAENLAETATATRADLDRARSEHDRARAEVRLLQVRLDRTTLLAPFAGVTGARTVSVGDFVNSSTVITTVRDLSRMKVEFKVPEVAIAKVSPGSRFELQVRAADGDGAAAWLAGEVYFVSPLIERDTRASEVKGFVDRPPAVLRPGMFATIRLVLNTRNQVLTVPESALLAREGRVLVVVAREKEGGPVAEFVPVRVGLRERGLVEISAEGGTLEAGTPVVASGVGGIVLLPGDRLATRPLRAELRPAPAA